MTDYIDNVEEEAAAIKGSQQGIFFQI